MWYVGKRREIQKDEVGTHQAKRPFGRNIFRWDDNIKKDLRHMNWEGVDRFYLAQDRNQRQALGNMVPKLQTL